MTRRATEELTQLELEIRRQPNALFPIHSFLFSIRVVDADRAWSPPGVISRVAGVIVVTLVVTPQAQAQGGIIQAIQAVLKVLNTLILPVVNSIHGTRSANSTFYQTTVWPVQSISQANAQVLQMMGQYGNLMSRILGINLRSATLPAPQSMETLYEITR